VVKGRSTRELAGVVAVGLALGYSLSRIGFSSWDRVHEMFTFRNLDLMIAFVVALAILAPAWAVTRKVSAPRWLPRPIHRGTLAGGIIFGVGWAISGSCPSIAAVQLGEGQLGGLFTLAGIFAGNYLYSIVHERWFRWSTQSCMED
jgi:uncharacterized membrane protein YedE/YeeE